MDPKLEEQLIQLIGNALEGTMIKPSWVLSFIRSAIILHYGVREIELMRRLGDARGVISSVEQFLRWTDDLTLQKDYPVIIAAGSPLDDLRAKFQRYQKREAEQDSVPGK